jgi:gluconokinase
MNTRVIIVMDVAGCGKTTVGKSLAKHLGWDFYDADDFHPPENIAKKTNGIPLNDADRSYHTGLPMLQALIFHQADDPNTLAYIGQIGQDIM